MADLPSSTGQARPQNGRTMGSTLPVPTTSTTKPKSPREIMREREKREADRQAMRQMQEEERNRTRTGRISDPAAGVGGSGEGIENRRSRQSQSQDTKIAGPRGYVQPTEAQPVAPAGGRGDAQTRVARDGGTRSMSQPLPQQSTRPGKTKANTQPAPQQREPQPRAVSNPAGNTRNPDNGTRQSSTATNNQTRNSSTTFPHAFERWETLSSHWEGLTSFWIKRLQGNSEELRDQPINQQLARQVTDLSAAGANLFHAVVELQRLRASSERKFQRWFFETRADQEKTAERIAQLEAELVDTRQGRPPAVTVPAPAAPSPEEVRKQAESLAADEIERVRRECALQIREKNRELEISREEARRGWEEIGRMETENRDRTYTLRRGERTMIGGVEVVPLVVGGSGHSRGASAGGLSSHPTGPDDPGYAGYDAAQSETGTDPFTETGRQDQGLGLPTSPRQPPSSSAAIQAARTRTTGVSPSRPQTAGQPFTSSSAYASEPLSAATAGGFYQQSGAGTSLHPTQTRTPARDDQGYLAPELNEDDYAPEEGLVDQYGQPIRPRTNPPSEISDEYDVLERLEREQLFSRGYPPDTSAGTATAQRYTTTSNGGTYQAPDYSGSGYGDRDWQSVVPRHHHPSRLSDVLEEDERSRTSETSRRIQQHQ